MPELNLREILEGLVVDNKIYRATTQIKSLLKNKLPKKFFLDDFSLAKEYWKRNKEGFNQALTEIEKIVEEL